jgi:hypothetical protein
MEFFDGNTDITHELELILDLEVILLWIAKSNDFSSVPMHNSLWLKINLALPLSPK